MYIEQSIGDANTDSDLTRTPRPAWHAPAAMIAACHPRVFSGQSGSGEPASGTSYLTFRDHFSCASIPFLTGVYVCIGSIRRAYELTKLMPKGPVVSWLIRLRLEELVRDHLPEFSIVHSLSPFLFCLFLSLSLLVPDESQQRSVVVARETRSCLIPLFSPARSSAVFEGPYLLQEKSCDLDDAAPR